MIRLLVIFFLIIASCSEPAKQSQNDENQPAPPDTSLFADCPNSRPDAEMVLIKTATAAFCIDRYEAYLISGTLGNTEQNSDPTALEGDGTTSAIVGSQAGKMPLNNVSWYQAMAACKNSGARLCTKEEWELACGGPEKYRYPYGNEVKEQACNDQYYYAANNSGADYVPYKAAAAFASCQSIYGVYDLCGNLEEWVATAVPFLPDSSVFDHRLVRGGSYKANDDGMMCTNPDTHYNPNEAAVNRSFRCCIDQ